MYPRDYWASSYWPSSYFAGTAGTPWQVPAADPWLDAAHGLAPSAAAVRVWRYPRAGESAPVLMDDLEVLEVAERIGPHWPTATFRYRLGTAAVSGGPRVPEDAVDSAFVGAKVVEPDDRLWCEALMPDGATWVPFFAGRPANFGLELSAAAAGASFACKGIAGTAWDVPLGGAVWRHADDPVANNDFASGLHARFNPRKSNSADSDKNCVVDAIRSTYNGRTYAVFIDPNAEYDDAGAKAKPWETPQAARHVVYEGLDYRTTPDPDITPPDDADFDMLYAREPIDGAAFSPADPSTYTTRTLYPKDLPITGKAWPVALDELIGGRGFQQAFETARYSGSYPATDLRLIDTDTAPLKYLNLQAYGATLDLAQSNTPTLRAARDLDDLANAWLVEGAPVRHEAGFLCVPQFPMTAGDEGAGNVGIYAATAIEPGDAAHDAYRTFVFAEDGAAHYVAGTSTALTDVPDLRPLLGRDDAGKPAYAVRSRRPIDKLVTRDEFGRGLKARLYVSTDFVAGVPQLWDGTGTWQQIHGGWTLLDDRIGFRVTAEHPEDWNVGKTKTAAFGSAGSVPFPSGHLNLVSYLASSAATYSGKRPRFLLVCTIEADDILSYTSGPTAQSPIGRTVLRRLDAADRWRKEIRSEYSPFNDSDPTFSSRTPQVLRDDTAYCRAEAVARRQASEAGLFAGSATIPHFTLAYRLGDRLGGVAGRAVSFRTDSGAADSYPTYPTVIARRWSFSGDRQSTSLEWSDGRRTRVTSAPPARPASRADRAFIARATKAARAEMEAEESRDFLRRGGFA